MLVTRTDKVGSMIVFPEMSLHSSMWNLSVTKKKKVGCTSKEDRSTSEISLRALYTGDRTAVGTAVVILRGENCTLSSPGVQEL
jgi:hypothetical protein